MLNYIEFGLIILNYIEFILIYIAHMGLAVATVAVAQLSPAASDAVLSSRI